MDYLTPHKLTLGVFILEYLQALQRQRLPAEEPEPFDGHGLTMFLAQELAEARSFQMRLGYPCLNALP